MLNMELKYVMEETIKAMREIHEAIGL
jgi:hypothetical protein